MRNRLFLLVAALTLIVACHPKPAPSALHISQGQGFQLTWDGRDFLGCEVSVGPRLTMQENGDDIPIDVSPRRTTFTFKAVAPRYYVQGEKPPVGQPAHLQVIPLQDASVPDFPAAYPDLVSEVEALKNLLKARPTSAELGSTLPEWECIDEAQTIHARIQYWETPWCSGVFFLTQHTQEDGIPISNEGLVATFQGLSKDGRFLIEADFPVTHPAMTSNTPNPLPDGQTPAFHRAAEAKLNRSPATSFSPDLGDLRNLVFSLRPQP